MIATAIILSVVVSFAIVIPALFILMTYVIKPHKTLREGLKDWIEESRNDI